MPNWLRPATAPTALVFVVMGLFGAVFAWTSYNLITIAMANYKFIAAYGLLGLREGGLFQIFEIAAYGLVSLAAYLGFKSCEHILVHRWTGH